jgi:hypothetical protein
VRQIAIKLAQRKTAKKKTKATSLRDYPAQVLRFTSQFCSQIISPNVIFVYKKLSRRSPADSKHSLEPKYSYTYALISRPHESRGDRVLDAVRLAVIGQPLALVGT